MSHTITVTRLPDETSDDVEYTIGGTHDRSCSVWGECEERHPRATLDELQDGEAIWHDAEHLLVSGVGWCVLTTECGLDYAYDLGLEVEALTGLGTYELDADWTGDGWDALIGEPVTVSADLSFRCPDCGWATRNREVEQHICAGPNEQEQER